MNRLTASQKSSRTMTMAWTRSPSHCRSAADELRVLLAAPGVEPLLELVQDQEQLLAGTQGTSPTHRSQRIDQLQS